MCFPCGGEKGVTVGERGCATPSGAGSVGRRWWPTRGRWVVMAKQEE